jgi:hypothetical protein
MPETWETRIDNDQDTIILCGNEYGDVEYLRVTAIDTG